MKTIFKAALLAALLTPMAVWSQGLVNTPTFIDTGFVASGATSLMLEGTALWTGSLWQYRYTITNTSSSSLLVDLAINEATGSHAGYTGHDAGNHQAVHDEIGFTGIYDSNITDGSAINTVHDYAWLGLTIGANSTFTVGFDDGEGHVVLPGLFNIDLDPGHGPYPESWVLDVRDGLAGIVVGDSVLNMMPVPAPEPGTLALAGSGFAALLFIKRLRKNK